MKNISLFFYISLVFCLFLCRNDNQWTWINQMGYRTNDIKVAVFFSKKDVKITKFQIIESKSGQIELNLDNLVKCGSFDPFTTCHRLTFTSLKKPGNYRIIAGKAVSLKMGRRI